MAWDFFGNSKNCHGVIAAIKRKQSNEIIPNPIRYSCIMKFNDLTLPNRSQFSPTTPKKQNTLTFVARQIIEKLIEQSRRLKSISNGVHASVLCFFFAEKIKSKHETMSTFRVLHKMSAAQQQIFVCSFVNCLFFFGIAIRFSISISVCTFWTQFLSN